MKMEELKQNELGAEVVETIRPEDIEKYVRRAHKLRAEYMAEAVCGLFGPRREKAAPARPLGKTATGAA